MSIVTVWLESNYEMNIKLFPGMLWYNQIFKSNEITLLV